MRRSVLGLVFSVLHGITMLSSASADPATPISWQAKMRALGATMNELLPQLVSRHPEKEVVFKHARTLAELAHAVRDDAARKMTRPSGDADPSLPILANQFVEDAEVAYAAVKSGQLAYGVSLLRSVTGHCIACHTRHEANSELPSFPLSPKTNALGRVEQADLITEPGNSTRPSPSIRRSSPTTNSRRRIRSSGSAPSGTVSRSPFACRRALRRRCASSTTPGRKAALRSSSAATRPAGKRR
ncbi:MAG: hypothetical protein H0V34_03000 [Gammaproteobacteria bacterium]|nr:hypothetical protein [Gammaproteobacteria bacterium]